MRLPRGRFVEARMTRTQGLRLLGYLIMAVGAWYYWPLVIVCGLSVNRVGLGVIEVAGETCLLTTK